MGEGVNTFSTFRKPVIYPLNNNNTETIMALSTSEKNSLQAATIRVKQYIETHNLKLESKKHNEMFRVFFNHIGKPKVKCFRKEIIEYYKSGALENYKPEPKSRREKRTTQKSPIKAIPIVEKPKKVESFYQSMRWADMKKIIYSLFPVECMKCKVSNTELHIDHIYPVSKYPDLKWSFNNLQILCRKCNLEKSNIDFTDYRTKGQQAIIEDYIGGYI